MVSAAMDHENIARRVAAVMAGVRGPGRWAATIHQDGRPVLDSHAMVHIIAWDDEAENDKVYDFYFPLEKWREIIWEAVKEG